MKLLVQPDDGAEPLLRAIAGAESSIDLNIFRLAYPKLERAIADAVLRGVTVRALIAHTNGSGAAPLRKLESRLLDMGVTVSRTDDDLVRYHAKLVVVDREALYVLGYNFTRRDIEAARSFGLVTRHKSLVAEGLRLFEADFNRQPYTPGLDQLVVSPFNARAVLLQLIEGARKQLLIYDPRLSDSLMQRAIERRALAGVEVRILGKLGKDLREVKVEDYPAGRMHIRAIVQDAKRVFIGSQSLRRVELDRRREVGVITDNKDVVRGVTSVFDDDWAETPLGRRARKNKTRKNKKKKEKARK
jgi:phosphatidylserine/phosphatidylglycerophosphate/cardiolipin synthase-like enzyme